MDIAIACRKIFNEQFPAIAQALDELEQVKVVEKIEPPQQKAPSP
jgi:hypothetical protein